MHRKTTWLDWPKQCYKWESPFVIGVLEGDGIGPDLIRASLSILDVIQECTSIRFDIQFGGKIGSAALQEYGMALTPQVIEFCSHIFAQQGALFCGPGGGRFVYELRKQFNVYCKIVPIQPLPVLNNIGPLKSSAVNNVDILVVRENLGGLYQGQCQLKGQIATHTFSYHQQHVDQILTVAVRAAKTRRKKLSVITKPGGAPSISTLWRQRAEVMSQDQELDLQFLEVDNAAFQIIANAEGFDVVVAPNLFGDVIADGAALLLGSRGLSYSANYGENGIAVYQTGHGAAYDLMGKDVASPLGQLFTLAMMLEESFGLSIIANQLRASIQFVLGNGWRTRDIMAPDCQEVGTKYLATLIAENFRLRLTEKNRPLPLSTNLKQINTKALLLIDMQNDFLDRLSDTQLKRDLLEKSQTLLSFCRSQKIPVLHIHTNGINPMPHWLENQYRGCQPNTNGFLTPAEVSPKTDELILYKRFFNAFSNPDLVKTLRAYHVETVILSGLYLHACIRTSAIAAYEQGFKVWIVNDAVASTEPLHAELSRIWLKERVADFYSVAGLTQRLLGIEIFNSNDTAILKAVHAANNAWKIWREVSMPQRIDLLVRWQTALERMYPQLLQLMIQEIHKPFIDAEEELKRTLAHMKHTIALTKNQNNQFYYQPIGVCNIITPWNNPVAIPISKIAPALLFGNTVIWKPSPLTPKISALIMQTFTEVNALEGLVMHLNGEQETIHNIISQPEVKAVSLTGSIATGRSVSALCHLYEKPFQAELGGNNACIILGDVDLKSIVEALALSAFSFSGQRCTAIRRFIVEVSIAEKFETLLAMAVRDLRIGDPSDTRTQIGPVINMAHLRRVQNAIDEAVAQGAKIVCGGKPPSGMEGEAFWEPTVLTNVQEHFNIVMEETFGPVAMIQIAKDIKDAVRLANNVPHGLLAGILTHNRAALTYFKSHIEAGILKLSAKPLAIQPDLPFGGWKASRQGPPEHGLWDQFFYTRPQAIYE